MTETIVKRLASLLSVKSLVTLILTVVFGILTVNGNVEQSFMTIYTVIVSFYFGIQSAKGSSDE